MPNRTCSITECQRPARSRGWCRNHYRNWQRTGNPLGKCIPMDTMSRFWRKVDKQGPNGCWVWTAGKDQDGYGHFRLVGTDPSATNAHRAAWILLRGPIPDGLQIDHLCRNKGCVNPDHLEPVTQAENIARCPWSAIQMQRAKTHCPRGHEYTPENTYTNPAGRRHCRTCRKAQSIKDYAKKKRNALSR